MNQADFAGRVALITGGARGIGRACAEEFYRRGAAVVIVDAGVGIDGSGADPSIAQQFAVRLGERALAFTENLSGSGAAQRAVAVAIEKFGAIDIVVNNAAILRDAFIFKASAQAFENVLAVNLLAPMAVLAAATQHLREQVKNGRAPGRIVNMLSSAGLFGNFGQAAYAASKAGLLGLTRVVAMDLARSKITCNAVVPFAATRVTESIQAANEAQSLYKERALSIAPMHVARLVAALSEDANQVTGQIIGARGREVFLFSQPRPVMRATLSRDEPRAAAELRALLDAQWGAAYTDLTTDLEFFNTEPAL